MKRYEQITDGTEAKIQNGRLYVRITNMVNGCLEQGGRLNRVISMPYDGDLEDAQEPINEYGTTTIALLIKADRDGRAKIHRNGTLIQ